MINSFDDYHEAVKRTLSEGSYEALLPVMALGLAGESGEVADLVKKAIGHGHKLDLDSLKLEMGDVLWYLNAMAELHGFTLTEVANANADKLARRYPDGFSHQASRNRPVK